MKLEMNKTGLAGEFRVVVKRADGTVKIDTGMQKNLFLDNGLMWYLGGEVTYSSGKKYSSSSGGGGGSSSGGGGSSMDYLVLGGGNSEPNKQNTKLDTYIGNTSTKKGYGTSSSEVIEKDSSIYVKCSMQYVYLYISEKNINITELGLASYLSYEWEGDNKVFYYNLITRSLIKQDNSPITISLLEGEILEVTYKLIQYIDVTQKTDTFKLTLDNKEKTYKYILDYLGFEKSSSSITGKLYFGSGSSYINTYGALDLKHLNFESLFKEKILELRNGSTSSDIYDYSKYGYSDGNRNGPTHDRYSTESIKIDGFTKTITITSGIYTHVYENGIRAILFYLGNGYSDYVKYIVVVWDSDGGEAIMKTNKQLWEATFSYTVSRWES